MLIAGIRHGVEAGKDMGDPGPGLSGSGEVRIPWRAAIGLLVGFRHAIREQRKLDAPEIVILNEKASRVAQQAEALARAGRLDEEAVAELRRAAGRSRHALPDALQSFKARGMHLEWREYNRSVRLLDAAINKAPVADEDPAISERLDESQRLSSLETEVAFSELAARDPGLMTLWQRATSMPVKEWPRSPDEFREDFAATRPIFRDLRAVVGSERADHDPILGSETAYGICAAFLRSLRYVGKPLKFDRPAE